MNKIFNVSFYFLMYPDNYQTIFKVQFQCFTISMKDICGSNKDACSENLLKELDRQLK